MHLICLSYLEEIRKKEGEKELLQKRDYKVRIIYIYVHNRHAIITRCAYAQGRVKRLSPSIYICVCVCVCVCVSAKNTAVCCLTARKSPRNSSLPLGVAIYILRKMPRKPEESSVECYGHGFLIAARPRGV